MAEAALRGVTKRFGATEAVSDLTFARRGRRIHRAARPDRRGQDHDAAPVRRAGDARWGPRRNRRARRHRARSGATRCGVRVPAIFALSALFRVRQSRLSAACAGPQKLGRNYPETRTFCRGNAAYFFEIGQPRDGAFRRRNAACRHRPRPGARARPVPDGRAALLAGREAARGSARRAEAHPARTRRDHHLCHPRPARGHDARRPHRGAVFRQAPADRLAARNL